jgi:hypothetical protein
VYKSSPVGDRPTWSYKPFSFVRFSLLPPGISPIAVNNNNNNVACSQNIEDEHERALRFHKLILKQLGKMQLPNI